MGLDNLYGNIVVRKFYIVYCNGYVAAIMLFLAFVALLDRVFHRKSHPLVFKDGFYRLLRLYVIVGGLFFFNTMLFSHAMLHWTCREYRWTFLWSLGIAAFPVFAAYINLLWNERPFDPLRRQRLLLLVPLIHTIMALIYFFSPFTGCE